MKFNIPREARGNGGLTNKTLEDMKVIDLVVRHLGIYGLNIEAD